MSPRSPVSVAQVLVGGFVIISCLIIGPVTVLRTRSHHVPMCSPAHLTLGLSPGFCLFASLRVAFTSGKQVSRSDVCSDCRGSFVAIRQFPLAVCQFVLVKLKKAFSSPSARLETPQHWPPRVLTNSSERNDDLRIAWCWCLHLSFLTALAVAGHV